MNTKTMEFVVYIIHEIANQYHLYPSKVYQALENSQCIQNYLVPFYDVLHTMSSQAILEDVMEYLNTRGVAL